MGAWLWVVFGLWMLVALAIETSAILDAVFNLGWGFKSTDPLFGLLFIICGLAVFALLWFVHRLVGWMVGTTGL